MTNNIITPIIVVLIIMKNKHPVIFPSLSVFSFFPSEVALSRLLPLKKAMIISPMNIDWPILALSTAGFLNWFLQLLLNKCWDYLQQLALRKWETLDKLNPSTGSRLLSSSLSTFPFNFLPYPSYNFTCISCFDCCSASLAVALLDISIMNTSAGLAWRGIWTFNDLK